MCACESIIKPERLRPHEDLVSAPGAYQAVKIRASSLDNVPARPLHHQATSEIVRDLLKYDEIPGITNLSQVALPPGDIIERHVHPTKYEVFMVLSGSGRFKVWSPGADVNDEPREVIYLKTGVSVNVGPEEPHEITPTGEEALVMLYFGVVAPNSPSFDV